MQLEEMQKKKWGLGGERVRKGGGVREKQREREREGNKGKEKEKEAGHISMLAIKIHNLITHFFTIPSIKPFNQLRHFNRINSIVFFSHTQCSSGLSFMQENCFFYS